MQVDETKQVKRVPRTPGPIDPLRHAKSGILLPDGAPLRTKCVADGLYVVTDNPYTERYDYFESFSLYRRDTRTANQGHQERLKANEGNAEPHS